MTTFVTKPAFTVLGLLIHTSHGTGNPGPVDSLDPGWTIQQVAEPRVSYGLIYQPAEAPGQLRRKQVARALRYHDQSAD